MPGRHSHRYASRPLTFADVMAVRKICTDWFGPEQENAEYVLFYPSSQVRLRDFDDVKAHWKKHGKPVGLRQRRWNSGGRETIFDASDPSVTVIEAHSAELDPIALLDDLAFALDLAPYKSPPRRGIQSAFIAVRFNDEGRALADDLIKMLATIGINAETAEDFQGREIPEKVKQLIRLKDLFIAIVVPQDDKAWIVSETVFANDHGKPIIIAEQEDANFQPGILGQDRERVRFPVGRFAEAFLPVLQGIRHLQSDATE
jgi:hypothetical protein